MENISSVLLSVKISISGALNTDLSSETFVLDAKMSSSDDLDLVVNISSTGGSGLAAKISSLDGLDCSEDVVLRWLGFG